MKKLLFTLIILMFAWSCTSSRNTESVPKSSTVSIDSTEYEITIIDTEFDTWYLMNYSRSKDFSNDYYRSKNHLGVNNWNDYFNRGRYGRVIENYIYYQYSIDYGIEVNRKLFWYFKFVEEKYRIRLLN